VFSILNVRLVEGDLTAEARIRDAALARFPRDGFEGTTVRAIAEDAGVSAALVVHHYGSKEGLRNACDAYVVDRIRTVKGEIIESDSLTDPSAIAGGFQIAEPLMRYLGWALATGSDDAASLFDELVDESVRLTELAEEHGAMVAGPDVRTRAAVMLSMQMGALVLQDHLRRYLDIDPLSVEGVMAISRATLEIFSGAMFAPGQAEAIREALEVAIENTRKESSDG
jgi:AcrR family transcriptional regulator